MNKTQLIDALAARYEGNRRQAAHALDSVIDTITREVARGEKVAITGFGSFEKTVRNARWVRNPQSGERMKSKKKAVPRFAAGKELKDVISGAKKLPKLTAATMPKPPSVRTVAAVATAPAKAVIKKATPTKAPAKKASTATKKTATKKTATKSTPAKSATAKKAPAKKASATKAATKSTATKSTAAKKAPAKKASATKTAAKSTPAKKAPAKSTAAKSTAAKSTAAKSTAAKKAPAKKS